MSVGRVLGTQDAMPLEFWVAIQTGEYLELDDVVVVRTELPDGRTVTLHGVVDLVKARHEGVQFDSEGVNESLHEARRWLVHESSNVEPAAESEQREAGLD